MNKNRAEKIGRRVVVYELMSLDGFADEPGEGKWLRDTGSGLGEFLAETIATQDTVLLGRRTYEKWAPYWPTADVQPFADFINTTTKYVFTSSPIAGEWRESTAVADPAAAFVADLKQRSGGDIGIHGSLSVARALLAAHLVDDIRLVIAPTIAGNGTRLFSDDGDLQRFELVSDQRSGGCMMLYYRRSGRI
ncbi:dihydrofolate reductase family protein [Microbacterium sp. USTB-Y]|uniref:dihydrofolate reductase family protein n=1 Tax=Microbacterium sp. USTB-Y TaxID=2823692 RepID=UPI0027E21D1F|nr:dihydrofolate reductase family protein [Microbacterium sp. USTB-Y]